LNQFLLGAIAAACFVLAMLLLRSWRKSEDRLFLLFALAFALEGLNRTVLASTPRPNEGHPLFYLVRFASFAIILAAILDKNRAHIRK
jgi:uncharacterized membrane protein HdeD (DUF308 family)